jgi:hypothetical protein
VEPVLVNAELHKERAVFGVELVPEQVKVIHVGQHGRKVPAGHRSAGAAGGRGVVGGFVPSDVAAGSAGRGDGDVGLDGDLVGVRSDGDLDGLRAWARPTWIF